jgi:hypothetical protein
MQNHLVRRVDAQTRQISTVAGTGQAGFSGDAGPAIRATFKQPHSIQFDQQGGLFFSILQEENYEIFHNFLLVIY